MLELFLTYVHWPSTFMGVLMINCDNVTSLDPNNVCIGQCHTFKCIELKKSMLKVQKYNNGFQTFYYVFEIIIYYD